jgi:hypothetical protein
MRTDKWGCIKLKTFCIAKETISRIKRQHGEWEKNLCQLFKGQRINIQSRKNSKYSTPKEQTIQLKEWAKKSNLFERRSKNTNKHMKKCSPFLAIKEIQIKMTPRFHLGPVRMAAIKKTNKINIGEKLGGGEVEGGS